MIRKISFICMTIAASRLFTSCALVFTNARANTLSLLRSIRGSSSRLHYISKAVGHLESGCTVRKKLIHARGTSSRKSDIGSHNGDSVKEPIVCLYETLNIMQLCGASCFVVRSPSPPEVTFRFSDEGNFTSSLIAYQNQGIDQNSNSGNSAAFESSLDCSHSIDAYSVVHDDLSTEELVFGRFKEHNNKSRLNKFIGGRIALRRALKTVGRGLVPSILKDDLGAPLLPDGVIGSISHKDNIAVGVAAVDCLGRIGVDIERTHNKSSLLLSRRLLTQREQIALGSLPGISPEEEVLLRFSFKESVFKAIHPFLRRPVSFTEVEVDPRSDGTAAINFILVSGETFKYETAWRRHDSNYWLTCVYLSYPAIEMNAL